MSMIHCNSRLSFETIKSNSPDMILENIIFNIFKTMLKIMYVDLFISLTKAYHTVFFLYVLHRKQQQHLIMFHR